MPFIPMNEGMSAMTNGSMMIGGGFVMLLVLAVIILSIAALVKYLLGSK